MDEPSAHNAQSPPDSGQERDAARKPFERHTMARTPPSPQWTVFRRLALLGFVFFGLGCFVVFFPGSAWSNLVQMLPTFVMVVGFFFVGDGLRHREGTEEYCARCGYQRTQGGLAATDAARCPECGHAWFGWQGTVIGQRTTSWWRVGVAACCGLLWLTLLVGQFYGLNTYRILPTSGLIEAAAKHRGFDDRIWDAIAKRTLTTGQHRELTEAILQRRTGRRLSQGASRWIEGQLAAGALSSDLVERYFGGMALPRLVVAHGQVPAVGERFDVHVVLTDNSNIFGAHLPFLHVRSLTASRDAASLSLPQAPWLYPHQASDEFAKPPSARIAGPAGTTRPPTITIRPLEPGVITVAAEVYVVIALAPGVPTLNLDPQGNPMQPAGTPFFKRFDLTLDVTVLKPAAPAQVAPPE